MCWIKLPALASIFWMVGGSILDGANVKGTGAVRIAMTPLPVSKTYFSSKAPIVTYYDSCYEQIIRISGVRSLCRIRSAEWHRMRVGGSRSLGEVTYGSAAHLSG